MTRIEAENKAKQDEISRREAQLCDAVTRAQESVKTAEERERIAREKATKNDELAEKQVCELRKELARQGETIKWLEEQVRWSALVNEASTLYPLNHVDENNQRGRGERGGAELLRPRRSWSG